MNARKVDQRMKSGRLPMFAGADEPERQESPQGGFAGQVAKMVNWLEGAHAWAPGRRSRRKSRFR